MTEDSIRAPRARPLPLSRSSPGRPPAAAPRTQAVAWASGPTIDGPPEFEHIVRGTDERPFP
ncbi:MAG: hypothetical protein OEV99_17875, partial [Nitrospira sp.]|nr:hypothetical protein [Nitrospira sp.]